MNAPILYILPYTLCLIFTFQSLFYENVKNSAFLLHTIFLYKFIFYHYINIISFSI